MSFGKNLQYLRQLSSNMTQEMLAEKLNVSRQTISKWEMDAANPEMDKALEICKIFNCSLDNLFREDMDKRSDAYSNLRVEDVVGFRYIAHTVISTEPESDAIGRMYKIAKENGAYIVFANAGDWNAGFFRKNGFDIKGELEDYPRGHRCFELEKRL